MKIVMLKADLECSYKLRESRDTETRKNKTILFYWEAAMEKKSQKSALHGFAKLSASKLILTVVSFSAIRVA